MFGRGRGGKNEAGKSSGSAAGGGDGDHARLCAARQGGTKLWPCTKGSVESVNEVWYDKRHPRDRDITSRERGLEGTLASFGSSR